MWHWDTNAMARKWNTDQFFIIWKHSFHSKTTLKWERRKIIIMGWLETGNKETLNRTSVEMETTLSTCLS